LDGQVASTTGVVNMGNRIQNRNSGYSDAGFFSKGSMMPNNSVNSSISGATALKLDEEFEVGGEQQSSLDVQEENMSAQEETIVQNNNEEHFLNSPEDNTFNNEINTESSTDETMFEIDSIEQISTNEQSIESTEEENVPKLFSGDISLNENNTSSQESEQKLFDQENNQEDDFEIPAFLRRQKF